MKQIIRICAKCGREFRTVHIQKKNCVKCTKPVRTLFLKGILPESKTYHYVQNECKDCGQRFVTGRVAQDLCEKCKRNAQKK